mmetsp:Transcript_30621/g.70097  ORF Transcript_30621/g.70097 Transcript_30621/m.70097 type:complete len:111 (+) Transcript_30621:69-401(+)
MSKEMCSTAAGEETLMYATHEPAIDSRNLSRTCLSTTTVRSLYSSHFARHYDKELYTIVVRIWQSKGSVNMQPGYMEVQGNTRKRMDGKHAVSFCLILNDRVSKASCHPS